MLRTEPNVHRLIDDGAAYLARHGVACSRREAELLLAGTLGCPVTHLYLSEDAFAPELMRRWPWHLEQRAAGMPWQYIIEEADFCGWTLRVTPDTLIPRPETEQLVDAVVQRVAAAGWSDNPLRILELGTGSGCIALSLTQALKHATLIATDISAAALAVARANGTRLGLNGRITWMQADVIPSGAPVPFDIIVSNPPYIPTGELPGLPREVQREPRLSLDGGPDGLRYMRRIAALLRDWLRHDGWVAVEIGDGQAEAVNALFQATGVCRAVERMRDLTGIERIVIAQRA